MMKLRCVVERITYQNSDNGYSILKCAVKNHDNLVTVVGNLLDATVGSVLLVDGNWKVDPKYGRQFIAESWEETMPATVFGIEKYLGSGLIKGVGPKFAQRIVKQFGTDTLDVIEMEIERLSEVPSIGKKRIQKIDAVSDTFCFQCNDYCMDNYVSSAGFPFVSNHEVSAWNEMHLGKKFYVWNRHRDYDYCRCLSGYYENEKGSIRFYFRIPGDVSAPEYYRQLVYTADNHLQTGFGNVAILRFFDR